VTQCLIIAIVFVVLYLMYAGTRWLHRKGWRTKHCKRGHFYCPACHYDVTAGVRLRCTECGENLKAAGVAYANASALLPVGLIYIAASVVSFLFAAVLVVLLTAIGVEIDEFPKAGLDALGHGFMSIAVALTAAVYLGIPAIALKLVQDHNHQIDRDRDRVFQQYHRLVRDNANAIATRRDLR
jgi:hypothetical protein